MRRLKDTGSFSFKFLVMVDCFQFGVVVFLCFLQFILSKPNVTDVSMCLLNRIGRNVLGHNDITNIIYVA